MKFDIATEPDVDQLVELINTCYCGEESKKGWTTEADLLGGDKVLPVGLRHYMQKPHNKYLKWTDEVSGKIVACAFAQHQPENIMHIGLFCVHPDQQSKGLGRKMMTAVEDHGRRLNCSILRIHVISIRSKLIGWLERLGFRQSGEPFPLPQPDLVLNPEVPLFLVFMEKSLELRKLPTNKKSSDKRKKCQML